MRPILFSKTSTTFTTNGLGRLDAISCKVIEERNGAYELEMEIAETADHASQIEADSIIVAKPSQADSLQPFRVYKLTKPINGKFTVLARHISYELNVITTMPFSVAQSAQACANTLAALKSNAVGSCPFSFSTDVTTASSYKQTVPASIRSRLGGSEGSVLQQFGGELKWDNYNVYLYSHRGLITPQVTLRYGKNIIDFNQEENIENTITGIVPYWTNSEGGDLVTLTEKVIEVPNASSFPYKKSIPMDFSRDFDEKPTQADLKAKAQAYVNTNNIGVPKVSIKLSFVNLSDTVDYKDIAAFQTVSLCDMVNVQFEKLGISTTAEVIKTDYDVLKERYNSIEIGSLRSTLASTISGAMQEIGDIQTTTQEMIKTNNTTLEGYADNAAKDYFNDHITAYPTSQQMQTAINTATAWLTSADGYVIAIKDPNTGAWKELLFADHDDPEQWHNVLRINQNGIGFSSNGGQTYTQAWALDGHLVIGGTDVPSLTVYDSHNNVIFQTTAAGTIWNSTNSSMTQNGTLTIKNATISGGTLSVLKPNPSNPPVDSDYLIKVNASGLLWNLTNSSMTADGKLTINEANVSGIIKTQYYDPDNPTTAYIQLRPQWIDFFPPGANSPGARFEFSGSSGNTTMHLNVESDIQIISPSIQLMLENTSNAEGIYCNLIRHFAEINIDSYIRLNTGDLDLGCDALYIVDDEFGYAEGQNETISIDGNDLVFIKGIMVYYGPHEDNPYISDNPIIIEE